MPRLQSPYSDKDHHFKFFSRGYLTYMFYYSGVSLSFVDYGYNPPISCPTDQSWWLLDIAYRRAAMV